MKASDRGAIVNARALKQLKRSMAQNVDQAWKDYDVIHGLYNAESPEPNMAVAIQMGDGVMSLLDTWKRVVDQIGVPGVIGHP